MELKDLTGKHVLDAVDFQEEKLNDWLGDEYYGSVCRFRLDGIVYVAVEDPNDGYRSSMRELFIEKDPDIVNVFEPVEVAGRHRKKGEYGDEDDVLELIDTKTGGIVLEVGTSSVDDYYPVFVARFHPENMCINQG